MGGVGVVARTLTSDIVFSVRRLLPKCFDVQIAEIMAIQFGLEMAISTHFHDVIYESDSQLVVQNLQQAYPDILVHDLIGQDILQLSFDFNSVHFSFVLR